ncbi:hypothetical protein [Aureimonas sp. AU22]|uniref:hypothetical protein n=1 Tax=Aureimonas sp. AU22 TaxID=1638162 RepID=UPI00078133F2|nr:hypothetical protein [Aureimonas sp. AU22]
MNNRLFQITAWLALAVIVFVTVCLIELRPHDVLPVDYDRALAFGGLAALFVLAYPRSWVWVGLCVIVGAGGIELLQELSPSRHARMSDALIKAGGAALGVVLAWGLNVFRERRQRSATSGV